MKTDARSRSIRRPEVLHVPQTTEPHAGRGQVRVRVRAIGVNLLTPSALRRHGGVFCARRCRRCSASSSRRGRRGRRRRDRASPPRRDLRLVEGAPTRAGGSVVAKKPPRALVELGRLAGGRRRHRHPVLDARPCSPARCCWSTAGAWRRGQRSPCNCALRRPVSPTGSAANQALLASLGCHPWCTATAWCAGCARSARPSTPSSTPRARAALPDSIELRRRQDAHRHHRRPSRTSGIPFRGTAAMAPTSPSATMAELAGRKVSGGGRRGIAAAEAPRAHALSRMSHARQDRAHRLARDGLKPLYTPPRRR